MLIMFSIKLVKLKKIDRHEPHNNIFIGTEGVQCTHHLCTLGIGHVAIQSKCHVCHHVPVNPPLIEIINKRVLGILREQ